MRIPYKIRQLIGYESLYSKMEYAHSKKFVLSYGTLQLHSEFKLSHELNDQRGRHMRKIILIIVMLSWNHSAAQTLLHVSYDSTRELYQELNAQFQDYWRQDPAISRQAKVTIRQSHGGSGKQARSVIDGLQADVVSMALAFDIDAIAASGLLPENWQDTLPYRSAPYTSTIVFLVRKDNPKGIRDWHDLIRPDVGVITPNPKTSGAARWNYMAAWAFAMKNFAGDETLAKDFMKKLYRNVRILDAGSRGSTTSFAARGIGDVLITWESEAYLAMSEFPADGLQMITPSVSILTEPVVAVVDKVSSRRKSKEIAWSYLRFLYTNKAQEIIARHHFRPRSAEAVMRAGVHFPKLELVSIDELAGSWQQAHRLHFADGAVFDQIFQAGSQR